MGRPRTLRLTSCQAENSEFIGRAVAKYVEDRLEVATEFVDCVPWRERERLLDEGEIHAGWICGLPYVLKADCARPGVELLAAPVMSGTRYAGRPVYFSDIVVQRDSTARSFADLRGARWGYNEPRSHSGYNIVCYRLAQLGERREFFSRQCRDWRPPAHPAHDRQRRDRCVRNRQHGTGNGVSAAPGAGARGACCRELGPQPGTALGRVAAGAFRLAA